MIEVCANLDGPRYLDVGTFFGVNHAQAQVSLERIEVSVAVKQLVPVRDRIGRDDTVDGPADGDTQLAQCTEPSQHCQVGTLL